MMKAPLTAVIEKYADLMTSVMSILKHQLVVVKAAKIQQLKLLYDGRHVPGMTSNQPLICFVLGHNGEFIHCSNSTSDLPRIYIQLEKKIKCRPDPEKELWKLLGMKTPVPNPQTQCETITFLKLYKMDNITDISYGPRPYPHPELNWWHSSLNPMDVQFHLEAFTKKDYSIGFRNSRIYRDGVKFNKKEAQKAKEWNQKVSLANRVEPPDKFQQNRRGAVSTNLSGLNKARQLGCLPLEEMELMSHQLSKTVLSLWIDMDNEHFARYVTVAEDGQIPFGFAVNQDPDTWKKLFDHLFQRREAMIAKKKDILDPLMKTLKMFPKTVTSPWSACLANLKQSTKNLRVLNYFQNDFAMHSIKLQFAHYMDKHRKLKGGIKVKFAANHDLVALETPDLTIVSLTSYFELETILPPCPPPPLIQHKIKELKHQKHESTGNLSMLACCYQRGKILAPALLAIWTDLGHTFLSQFNFDIHSLSYASISYLSFNAIWWKYSRQAGPLFHSLEKTKSYYEDLIRELSHGGFSFSCVDKLDAGQAINVKCGHLEPAKTLVELDIASSYGFAASSMRIPKGFCVGYSAINDEECRRDCHLSPVTCHHLHEKEEGLVLKRTDPVSRHKTFEFQAVYYTIWKLQHEENLDILSAFSNFHINSYIKVSQKYILDLVVITTDGKIRAYQFDGKVSSNNDSSIYPSIPLSIYCILPLFYSQFIVSFIVSIASKIFINPFYYYF